MQLTAHKLMDLIQGVAAEAELSSTATASRILAVINQKDLEYNMNALEQIMYVADKLRDDSWIEGLGSDKYKVYADVVEFSDASLEETAYTVELVVELNNDGDGGLGWVTGN